MRTSPEVFFKNRQGSAPGGSPTPNPAAHQQTPAYGGSYYNTLTNTMPQGSIGMYGVKTTAPQSSPAQWVPQDNARTQYASTMSTNPAPNGSRANPNGYGNGWQAQQPQSPPLHPAIRPQYGAWVNQPQTPAQQTSQQTSQPTQQHASQQSSVTHPQADQTKPQAAPKPAAPKIQYKVHLPQQFRISATCLTSN